MHTVSELEDTKVRMTIGLLEGGKLSTFKTLNWNMQYTVIASDSLTTSR